MENNQTINVIKELVEMSVDGERGFEDAAKLAEEPSLKALFIDCARGCSAAVVELNDYIASFGEPVDKNGSLAGSAHRSWQKIRAAMDDSSLAVLEEVERGEDHAKAAYRKALNTDLPAEARALVQKQYEGVLKNHDRIRNLRNTYRAQTA